MPRVQQSESDSRRLLLAATLGILLLTLTPISNPAEALSTFCILCGSYGTADFLLNVLMFAPLGYLICRVINYRSRALLVVVTATVAIELAQVLIPGRFPTLGDVVANIIGGSLGIWAVHVRAHQPDRSPHRGAQAAARTAPFALTAALILTGILLLRPALPASTYYGQWTADLGQFAQYAGQVHGVRVGPVDLPGHRLDAAETTAVQRIVRGVPLTVDFLSGPPTDDLAPVFSVFDEHQVEILVVGADADAIVVRMRRQAEALGFHAPDIRFERLHPSTGTESTLRLTHRASSFCIRLLGGESCHTMATPARGWSLFTGISFPDWGAGFLDFAWLALLGFLTVYLTSRSHDTSPSMVWRTTWFMPVLAYGALWLLFRGDLIWIPGLGGLIVGSAGATRFDWNRIDD